MSLTVKNRGVQALVDEINHNSSLPFNPNYYLLRDLCRQLDEKTVEEPWGFALGAEDFINLHDWRSKGEMGMYNTYYRQHYPQAVFYFWNGEQLEQMECDAFFQKCYQTFREKPV